MCVFEHFDYVALLNKTHCKGSASSKAEACGSPDEIEDTQTHPHGSDRVSRVVMESGSSQILRV